MEEKILEEISHKQELTRKAEDCEFKDGYLKALLNIKQWIKEEIDIRDKTGYYKEK